MLFIEKKKYWKYVTFLADLKVAIFILLLIALASISGTIIEQDQVLSFYKLNYPETKPILGFLNWKIIISLGLDHAYRTRWFSILIILLAGSLVSCTFLKQLPILKTSRQWKFYETEKRLKRAEISTDLNSGNLNRAAYILIDEGFYIFHKKNFIYAYKGLIGRVSPILVHASIILILFGALWGSLTGFTDQELIPKGEIIHLQNPIRKSPLGRINQKYSPRINNFWINFTDRNIDQFYTDISLLDQTGSETERKVIYVNETLTFDDITFYQTDWDILGLRTQIDNNATAQYSLSLIGNKKTNHLWRTFVTTNSNQKKNFLIILNDLTGNLYIYNNKGTILQKGEIGSIFVFKEFKLQILDTITATGLQVKSDPGIKWVYLGFAILIVSGSTSYITYSRLWIIEKVNKLYLGGSTNRASLTFQKDFSRISQKLVEK
uniref:Cytochrome c biogenesis protein Ccs1 n=1 Tax=Haptophyceae sp. NIES-3900 TaxID=2748608 RepID=A0A7R6WDT1_9EUKA|nr:Cytochrome c biogenesis protein [Haptophyceae sp. NIES-3900]